MIIPDPKPIQEDDFLALPEIAFLARDSKGEPAGRTNAEQWKARGKFPSPDDYVGYQPVWRLARVIAWLDGQQNWTHNVKAWRKRRDAGGFRRGAGNRIDA